MPDSPVRIVRLTGRLSILLALMVALSGPAAYFGISYQYHAASLETEAAINAQFATQFVSENPTYWVYMEDRLASLLRLKSISGEDHRRRLLDRDQTEIVSNNLPAAPPFVIRKAPFYDAGQVAGYIELTRTLRPLLEKTGYVFILFSAAGAFLYFSIRFIPLRALRDALNQLQESRILLQSVFQTFHDAVFILRSDTGQMLDCNPATERLFGASRNDLTGVGPEFRSRYLGMMEEAGIARPDEDVQGLVETEMRRDDGRTFPAEYSRAAFTDTQGRQIEVVAVRDISTRKEQENRILELNRELEARVEARTRDLSDREERLRFLFRKSPTPVLILDVPSGRILDANDSALVLLECTRQDCVSEELSVFIAKDNYDQFRSLIDVGENTPSLDHISEVEVITHQGTPRIVSVHVRRLVLGGKAIMFCSFFDITETVRLQEQWRLSLERLVQAEKMEFLGTMVSGFAHDINNPNQLIRTNVQMVAVVWRDVLEILEHFGQHLQDVSLGGFSCAQAKHSVSTALNDIESGSARISRIIRNLMGYAKEHGDGTAAEVNVNQVVEDAVMLLKHRIRQKTDNFRVILDSGLPRVSGNAQSLEQVVVNLLMNALESLPDPSRHVVMETRFVPEERNVLIRVEDKGTGMSADIVERSRKPFFTTKEKSGGSGLGLAITQMLINEHKGTLEIESVAGKGTTVTVTLPAA